MSFYLSLFIFILSLVAGLVLMIAGKDLKRGYFMILATIHLILLFAFLASLLLRTSNDKIIFNYFFMAYICSGVILSGLAWRSEVNLIIRSYFSIFFLTLPLFLFSPSMMLNFLLTMKFSSTYGASFPLGDRYFLEIQNSSSASDEIPHYKVILKRGLFHQTIQRDILFGGKLDSARVIEKEQGLHILIRGYTSQSTFVSTEIDSMDIPVQLKVVKQGDVEYHL